MSEPDDLVDFVVVLDDDADPQAVERALGRAGLVAIQRLDALGVILGRGRPGAAAAFRAVPGVRSVDLDHKIQLGPPGEPS